MRHPPRRGRMQEIKPPTKLGAFSDTHVEGRMRYARMEEIWDRFLTERDRKDCADNPVPERPLGRQPALLMVDAYRRAFKPEVSDRIGGPSRRNLIAAEAAACLPSLVSLLATARKTGTPVVHITKQSSVTSGIRDWAEPESGPTKDPGDDYDFVEELVPRRGEAVVRKTAPSAFMDSPLLVHLLRERIDTVVVAGESTSGCIRATVVDACVYGFRVGLVSDATFDRHEAAHAMNLFDMHRKYARLLLADEASQYLEALPRSYEKANPL